MNKFKVCMCLVCQLAYNLLNVLLAWLIMQITDSLVMGNEDIFADYLKIAAVVVVGQITFNYLSIRIQNNLICTSMNKVRTKSLDGVLNGKGRLLQAEEKAQYLAFFTNELEQYENSYLRTKLNLINSIMLLTLTGVMIFRLHSLLLVMILIFAVLMILVPFLFSKSLQKLNLEYLDSNKELIKKTEEILGGYEVIKSYFSKNRIVESYDMVAKKNCDKRRTFSNKIGASNIVIGLLLFTVDLK